MARLTATASIPETRDAFALLKEIPVRVAEVLSAGWIAANESKAGLLSEAFSNHQGDEIFKYMKKALDNQDELLMKSIEIVSVMRKVPDAPQ